MGFLPALVVVAGVVALAAVLGLSIRVRQGRDRRGDGSVFRAGDLPGLDALARGATLVQFSTEFCARCPATRRFLRRIVAERDGVGYVGVDLTRDPELSRRLQILQTPTVFILDPRGKLVSRFGGAPRPDEFFGVLDRLVPAPAQA